MPKPENQEPEGLDFKFQNFKIPRETSKTYQMGEQKQIQRVKIWSLLTRISTKIQVQMWINLRVSGKMQSNYLEINVLSDFAVVLLPK